MGGGISIQMRFDADFPTLCIGLIMADKALKTLWDNILQGGGKIMDNCPVQKIVPKQNSVQVVLKDGTVLAAKSLVVCAGAWTNPILEPLK